jgi:hypothetical protein
MWSLILKHQLVRHHRMVLPPYVLHLSSSVYNSRNSFLCDMVLDTRVVPTGEQPEAVLVSLKLSFPSHLVSVRHASAFGHNDTHIGDSVPCLLFSALLLRPLAVAGDGGTVGLFRTSAGAPVGLRLRKEKATGSPHFPRFRLYNVQ